MRALLPILSLLLFLSVIVGCGGGGGGGGSSNPTPTPTPTPTPNPTVTPHITLAWGERSRATGGLSSALSASIKLAGARPDGSDLLFNVNRDATLSAYNATVTAPTTARTGQWVLTVTFFGSANATGTVVGIGQAQVNLGADGNLPDIAIAATVKKVVLSGGQRATVGQKTDLTVATLGDADAVVPVSPGSVVFQVTQGAANLQFVGGQAQGIAPGDATVVATVDGISSAPVNVHVGSNTVITLGPNPAKVAINGTLQITAAVSGTTNQAVQWAIQEGNAGGTIDASGFYTAPGTPGTYHVVATSVYDPEKSAVLDVTVEAGNVDVGGDFPPTGSVGVGID